MCQISSCCGCMSLKQGTIASAILTIVLGGLNILFMVLAIVLVDKATDTIDHKDKDEIVGYVKIIYYIVIAVIVFWIITAILIFVGLSNNSRGFLMPWIVMTSITVAFSILGLLTSLGNIGAIFANTTAMLSFFINIGIIIIMIYGLICVHSFYKNDLQEGGGQFAGKV